MAEATNVCGYCVWILDDDEQPVLPCTEFLWLKLATILQVLNVLRPKPEHLYWPDIDVDLSSTPSATLNGFR